MLPFRPDSLGVGGAIEIEANSRRAKPDIRLDQSRRHRLEIEVEVEVEAHPARPGVQSKIRAE